MPPPPKGPDRPATERAATTTRPALRRNKIVETHAVPTRRQTHHDIGVFRTKLYISSQSDMGRPPMVAKNEKNTSSRIVFRAQWSLGGCRSHTNGRGICLRVWKGDIYSRLLMHT